MLHTHAGGTPPCPLLHLCQVRAVRSTPGCKPHSSTGSVQEMLERPASLAHLLPHRQAWHGTAHSPSPACPSLLCPTPPLTVQLLLTFDPELVPLTASLLERVLAHNSEQLSRFYSTGRFRFEATTASLLGSVLALVSG